MIFARRDKGGPDPFLKQKLGIFFVGGVLALAGMALDSSALVGVATLVLVGGVLLRFLTGGLGGGGEADRDVGDPESPGRDGEDGPGPSLPLILFITLLLPPPTPLRAQESPAPSGWEVTGLPALNFDSDEGIGFGALLALYDYGPGGVEPYQALLQPMLFFTTEGRRAVSLFVDAPHWVRGWRVGASVSFQKLITTPFYGTGNDAAYEPALEEGENPHFYRFGRKDRTLGVSLQRPIAGTPLRILFGGGISHVRIDPTPRNEGTTLLTELLGPHASRGGYENRIRGGIIWDTRDRESGPRAGVWSEGLVEVVSEVLGSRSDYTRWTLTDRRYLTLAPGLVFANRALLQGVAGSIPFYSLSTIASSFGGMEGLGGSNTLRGVLWNRFVGKGHFLWNAELRWRVRDFRIIGRGAHLALVGFLDQGRVWASGPELATLFTDLHYGKGGGVRVGLGPNFVAGFDLGHSSEAGLQTYIGLGYLF